MLLVSGDLKIEKDCAWQMLSLGASINPKSMVWERVISAKLTGSDAVKSCWEEYFAFEQV